MKKNLYIGGYSILDLNGSNVYKQALICAEQNKPVLVYDDPERYYADTIKIDTENDNNVVITKGGKTITINDANAVSSEGEIKPVEKHLYQYQVNLDNKDVSIQYALVFISDNPNFTKLSEILLAFKNSDYILRGFIESNTKTTIITNNSYEDLSADFEIYKMFDNETIDTFNLNGEDIELKKTQLI